MTNAVFKGHAALVLAFREETPIELLLLERLGLAFFGGVEIVQAAEEKKVGNLLNDFQRVGDAAGPKSIPDLINLRANFTSKHKVLWNKWYRKKGV